MSLPSTTMQIHMHSAADAPPQSLAPSATTAMASPVTRILAGKLFDPYSGNILKNRQIFVSQESGLVLNVQEFHEWTIQAMDLTSPDIIDLREQTVLPGFVDAHVHCECM